MAKIMDAAQGLKTEQIENIENHIGFSLPSQYRNFIKDNNGGYPDPDTFDLSDGSDTSSVDRFLSVGISEDGDLFDYIEVYTDRIPFGLIPIAHDPGGNLIVLGVSPKYYGQLFFWDHEREEETATMNNVTLISNSFQEFIESLYEFVDEE